MKYLRYVGESDRRVISVSDLASFEVEAQTGFNVTRTEIFQASDEEAEVLLSLGEEFEEVEEFEVLATMTEEEENEDNGNIDA